MRNCILMMIIILGGLLLPITTLAAEPDLWDSIGPEAFKPSGRWIEVEAPGTLDLAERARLSINMLTGNIDPAQSYSVSQAFDLCAPGSPKPYGPTWDILGKNLRFLPELRVMCGSEQGIDAQRGAMRAVLGRMERNGLVYYPAGNYDNKPDTASPALNGLMISSLVNVYEARPNPIWLRWLDPLSAGLKSIAFIVQNRAYYPPESSVDHNGKWQWQTRAAARIPYTPPEEPTFEQQGLEGCVKFIQAFAMRGLLQCYRYNNDPQAMELAGKLARFCMKPGMWDDEDSTRTGYPGSEHGLWAGHIHGNLAAIKVLLEYAIAVRDERMMQMMRDAYDYWRRHAVIRMGWSTGWIKPDLHGREPVLLETCETCAIADAIALGVQLSDAGLGDYWDDVDAIVRNELIEQQFTDLAILRRLSGGSQANDALLAKYVGGFGEGHPDYLKPSIYGCCSANGANGLYYAWHGITRLDQDVATVNLFLNRSAAWLDVESWLPYEGRVVIQNKQARTIMVRLPYWLDQNALHCYVNDKEVHPPLVGRYLAFAKVGKKARIRLEFTVPERQEQYSIHGKTYTLTLRGSTVVARTPPSQDPKVYPTFMREGFKQAKAPMRKARRFVADKLVPLQ